MFTGIHKHTIIGTMVAALALAAPAFGVELPDGYEMQSAESSSYSPQALQALNGRWEATARFHEQSTGYTPQALQAMNERWEATARFHEQSTGYTPQALQALGERGQAMVEHYGQVSTPISNVRQIEALERAVRVRSGRAGIRPRPVRAAAEEVPAGRRRRGRLVRVGRRRNRGGLRVPARCARRSGSARDANSGARGAPVARRFPVP